MSQSRDQIAAALIPVPPVHGSHSVPRTDGETTAQAQAKFLQRVGVDRGDLDKAWSKSWRAAVQRNPVYSANASETTKRLVRQGARELTEKIVRSYDRAVSDKEHQASIVSLSNNLSEMFSEALQQSRMRIGTSQKFLNLYLKYMWCFGQISEPPHCPLDRIVQQQAAIPLADLVIWTKLDSIADYARTIERLRQVAAAQSGGTMSLAQWELRFGW